MLINLILNRERIEDILKNIYLKYNSVFQTFLFNEFTSSYKSNVIKKEVSLPLFEIDLSPSNQSYTFELLDWVNILSHKNEPFLCVQIN